MDSFKQKRSTYLWCTQMTELVCVHVDWNYLSESKKKKQEKHTAESTLTKEICSWNQDVCMNSLRSGCEVTGGTKALFVFESERRTND